MPEHVWFYMSRTKGGWYYAKTMPAVAKLFLKAKNAEKKKVWLEKEKKAQLKAEKKAERERQKEEKRRLKEEAWQEEERLRQEEIDASPSEMIRKWLVESHQLGKEIVENNGTKAEKLAAFRSLEKEVTQRKREVNDAMQKIRG